MLDIMEYISQIDHLVEVLRFLLSKIPEDQYSNDVEILKFLGNMHSLVSNIDNLIIKQQIKEEGELAIDEGEKVVQSLEKDNEKLDNNDQPVEESDDPEGDTSHMIDKTVSVPENHNNVSQDGDLKEETGQKPINNTHAEQYQCETCGKQFPRRDQFAIFNRHVQSHSMGDPKIKCEHCSKCFFFEIDLRRHMNMHTFVYCDKCEFKTPKHHAQQLTSHMRNKHTMEKPFKCTTCDKGFATRKFLSNHIEIHDPVKKYECSVCGKKFRLEKHLWTHSKIHSKSYAGQCDICDKKFVQKYNMTLHMRKHHPEDK